MTDIVCICTGNATRSVLAEVLLADAFPHADVTSAGTLVIEGQPISWRTRAAFESIDVPAPMHRGRQAGSELLRRTGLVIAAAPEHVGWIRRVHPTVAPKTITMKRLVRLLHEPGAEYRSLSEFVDAHDLADTVLDDWEEIVDPGGGEVDGYLACAAEIQALVDDLLEPLGALLRASDEP